MRGHSGQGGAVDWARRSLLRGRFLTREGREGVQRCVRALGPRPSRPACPCVALQSENPCEYCQHPCLAACKLGLIGLHPEDHVLRGMSCLSFERGGCTFCRACVEVCPLELGDVGDTTGAIGLARLQEDACMAWNGVICMSCQFACS